MAQEIEDKGQDKQPSGDMAGMPKIIPGTMKFLMEFLKSNPDLAHEMSVRMQAVINGKQMQGASPQQNTMRPLAQGQQQPPMQMAGDVIPIAGEKSMGSGQTPSAAGYAVGKESDPKVQSIGMSTLQGWAQRQQGK